MRAKSRIIKIKQTKLAVVVVKYYEKTTTTYYYSFFKYWAGWRLCLSR